ncbi:MAG: hypothetical protein R2744_00155 [Bacteroidales bacterium]
MMLPQIGDGVNDLGENDLYRGETRSRKRMANTLKLRIAMRERFHRVTIFRNSYL